MKQGQYSQEQIAALLRRAEGNEQSISTLCREAGITETTFYRVLPCVALRVDARRNKYGSMTVSEAQRLKELEGENARLKRLLAARALEVDALKTYLAKK